MHELFGVDAEPQELPYLQALHPAQQPALADDSQEKAYLCGRRSGKSHLLACELLQTAEQNPGEMSLYVAITKGHARRNLGRTLERIHRKWPLPGGLTERDGQLFFKHDNGHLIWLAGCKHLAEGEKFRGDYYTRVVIDEGASFPLGLLEYLVDDAIGYALLDKQAPLTIAGTPGALPKGFFYEITTGQYAKGQGEAWPTHTWTMFDNRHVHDPRAWLDKRMKRRGWTEDHPSVQREVYAKWIKDESAIIYPYVASRNASWEMPEYHEVDMRVLSIDLGWAGDTTFTTSGSRKGLPTVWFWESYGKTEMTPMMVAAECRRLMQRYGGFSKIVIDEGGGGKQVAEGIKLDYGIPCTAAEKRAKSANIRFTADAIRSGRALFNATGCAQLIGEMQVLPWNDLLTDHHEQFADHCCDGMIYGYRCHPSHEKWEENPPEPGTAEAADAEMASYKQRISRIAQLEARTDLSPSRKRRLLERLRG